MATRISFIFPFLLATLLCVGGVELFYLGLEHYVFDTVSVKKVVRARTVESALAPIEKDMKVDYSIIVSRDLFGVSEKSDNSSGNDPSPVEEELETTTLEVVLMGTVGEGEEGSRAIILNKSDRKQELYKVGDVVQGALLKEIRRGKVILTVDGRNEMLDMAESRKYGQSAPQPVTARPPGVRRNTAVAPLAPSQEAVEAEQAGKLRVVRPSRRIVRPRPIAESDDTESEVEEVGETDTVE